MIELMQRLKAGTSYRLLEQRMVFDGAAVDTAADVAHTPDAVEPAVAQQPEALDVLAALAAAPVAPAEASRTIVFIDGAVENAGQIASAVPPGAEVVYLDPSSNGLEQIAASLEGRSDVDSVHIVSHGEAGSIYLGSLKLSAANIGQYADALQRIGAVLSEDADILVYGCDVASSASGEELIERLGQMTGADVAASTDDTGSVEFGGDWDLEHHEGTIEAVVINASAWDGTLAPIAITNTTNANTLANTILGNGITIVNASFTGANGQAGTFTSATGYTPEWLGFANGVLLSTGSTSQVLGPNTNEGSTVNTPAAGDAQLSVLSGGFTSHDAAVLNITFRPTSNRVTLQFTFGSEEYNEYVYSTFNDAMGVWVNGVQRALLPDGRPVNIDSVNRAANFNPSQGSQANDPNPGNGVFDSSNPTLYINNAVSGATFNTGMDGFTVTLSFVADVNPGVDNTIKIAVSDIGDSSLDSFVFLRANSFTATTIANTDSVVTTVNQPVIIDARANDWDSNNDPLTITHVQDKPITAGGPPVLLSTGGSVSLNLAGNLVYTPALNSTADDVFTYTISDGNGTTALGFVTVDINAPPVANADTFTTVHDVPVTINVRANDTDPEGNVFNVTRVNGTAITAGGPGVAVTGGIVTLNGAGNLVFTPNADYAGSPSFTYTIADAAGGTSTATVTGTVTNVAPALDLDASGAGTGFATVYTENGSPVSIADTDAAITDADDTHMTSATIVLTNAQTGDRLLVNGAAGATGVLPGGITWTRTDTSVTLSGSATRADYAAAIRAIQFENTTDTPATTARTINVTVNDGTVNSNTAVATIAIDRAPDPANDAFSGNEDATISGNVATNDTDLGDGGGSFAVATGPSNGTLTSFNTATGAFVYTPAANFNGTDTFTYSYTDADGDTRTATVTLTVNPVNDAPVNAVPATIGPVAEDGTLAITGVSVSDVDGGSLTTTVSMTNGVLNLGATGGAVVSGAGSGSVTLAGTAAQINAALATLAFTPTADFNGTSSFQILTTDGSASATTSRTVTVTAVADIANDSVTTSEDVAVTFAPLANDSFENGGRTITAINGSAIAAGGSVAVTGGIVTLNANGTLTFAPSADFNGTPSFDYRVTSGGVTETATVNVTVTAVNDAPTQVLPGPQSTSEDVSRVVTGASVADVDGGTLTTTLSIPAGAGSLSVVAGGGAAITGNGTATVTVAGTAAEINAAIASITYVPTADFNGAPLLSMSTTDGTATATGTTTITVSPVADISNDAVTTAEDAASTFNVLTGTNGATADTFENGGHAVTSVTQPANGTVTFAANGAITYTPSANFNGTDTFTYTVTSGGVTETATVTVTVTAVPDAPVNSVPGPQTTLEDTTLVFSAGNGNAITVADVDSNVTTTLTVANGTLTLGSLAGVSVTGNGSGSVTVSGPPSAVTAALSGLSFAPAADWNGATTLTVSTSDGVMPADVDTIAISVAPVIDIAPNAVSTAEDAARTFNVLANDSFEGSPVVSSVTQPANGTVTIGTGGNVTYTPNANYNGPDSFTYTVTSGGVTETTTVAMTVTPVNDAPTASGIFPRTSVDGATVSYNVGGFFSDIDGDTLSFSVSGLPAGLSINPVTGRISGTLDTSASTGGTAGVHSVAVTATDPAGASVTRTFNWTVTNPAPIIVDEAFSGLEDAPITGSVLANDSDPDGDALRVLEFTDVNGGDATAGNLLTMASGGTLMLNPDGSFTYTPAPNFSGVETVTYIVADADGAERTGTLTLYVNPVNDTPVAVVPGDQTTGEDTPLVFSSANGNAITVVDPDSATVTATLGVTHGTLTLGSTAGISITGGADGTHTITISGTPADVTAALAGLTYNSTPDYHGVDTLSITASDGAATSTSNIALTVTPVADIVADTVTTTEDAAISFNVVTGTNGAEADSFEGLATVTGFTQPANGSVTVDGAGNVVYTPNADFNGTDTFTYTVTSGGVTETTTVTVTVDPANDAPTQTLPGAQSGVEDSPVVFSGANGNQIVVGDIDGGAVVTTTLSVPAGTLAAIVTPGVTIGGNGTGLVTLTGAPAAVTAALNGLVYTPVADSHGSVSLAVSTSDGVAAPVVGAVAITVAPVADIQNDIAGTSEDTAIVVPVLGNDTFENGGRAVTAVTNGANGTVSINGDGTVTYTPNPNFNGTDSFTYTVTSGGVTETATVTVVVDAVNDAPTQTVPGAQVTPEDTSLVFSAAAGNAIAIADVDGTPLTTIVSATSGTLTLGAAAGVTVSGDGTGLLVITGPAAAINAALDGLAFAPAADMSGAAALTVTTTDGTASATSTIPLTVTPVADIVADTATTPEDTPVTFNVLANDNFESPAAAVTSVTQPAHGTVTIGAGGALTYTPDPNYHGPDSFTYTVTSGGVTETATVSLTVTPVNDALVTGVPGPQSTNEDAPLAFSSALGNAITVADVDGDTVSVTLSAANGTLTLGGTAGVTATGNGTGTVTVTGPTGAISAALNGLTFAPTADYHGAAAISVNATDGTASTSDTILISIVPVADIVADTVATLEDVPVTINVLGNDTFESAGAVVTSVSQGASGTVSFLTDGTVVYTPDANFNGVDTYTYTVTSGGVTETTTVTVTVAAVNDSPTTVGLPGLSSLDGQPVSIPVAPAFADVDVGDTLTYAASGLPSGLTIDPVTGVISGTIDSAASQAGPYTVVVTASDGHPGGTVSTSFTWAVANPGPAAAADAASTDEDTSVDIGVLANDTDPDGDPLTVTSAAAGNGTVVINGDGTLTYTPNAHFHGTDTIVYEISDGNGGVATATVTVTVSAVNDAPTTSGLGDLVDTDNSVVSIDVSSAFSDLDGDTLTYAVSGLPAGLAFNPATGEITGAIDPNASGPGGDASYTVTVTATDPSGADVTTSFTWRVLNIPPTSADDSVTTPEDTPVIATVLQNDIDPDNDPLVITHVNGNPITLGGPAVATANGQVALLTDAFGNHVLQFTPNADFNGVETLVYTISDGNSGIDTATLTINVTPVNDAPTAAALADLASADSDSVSVNVGSFFSDIDAANGDTLAFSAIGLPPGLAIDPMTGVISGTIDASASQSGPYAVVVTATDSAGAAVSQSFDWSVSNPLPTATNDARTVGEGAGITLADLVDVRANDTDPDNDPLVVSAINGNAALVGQPVAGTGGGVFTIGADGSLTFDQAGGFEDLQAGETRLTTVTYTISDGNGGVSTAQVSITVTGANDAPVASAIADEATVDSAPVSIDASLAFSDVDGDTLTYSVTGLPPGLLFDTATGQITGTLDSSASQGGAAGVYTVTVTADDGEGGTTPVAFTITVGNPAPLAANDTAGATEDMPTAGNVLANDSDPDGDALQVTGFVVAGVGGSFSPGDTATIPNVGEFTLEADGSYTFTPDFDYNGPVPVVTYTVADADGATDTATLAIGPVAAVNDAPVSSPIADLSSNDSDGVALSVASSFSDVDGDALTYSATGLPPGLALDPATGVITGTIDHLASASGPYTVTITAEDPDGETTSQVFTWAVTNPAPAGPAIPDATGVDATTVSIAAGAGFADPDGDVLTFSATGLPAGLSIDPATGVITGTLGTSASTGGPASDGVYAVTVVATDSQGAMVSRTFDYTVANPGPNAGNDDFTGQEDAAINGSVAGNDSDPDGDALTFTIVSGPAHGLVVMNPDGTFTYTPDADYNATDGRDTFTYQVADADGAVTTAVVTLTITPVNDAPVSADVVRTTPEDTPLTGTLTASDVDGDILSFAKATDPTHGTVVVNPDGTYTYTPDPDYAGPDSFDFTVSDGNGGTVTHTVSITVTPANDPPVASADTATTPEDTPVTIPVLSNDVDIDGTLDPATVQLVGTANPGDPLVVPGQGTWTVDPTTGAITFTPAANYAGPVTPIQYTVADNSGDRTSPVSVGVTVTPVNDAPMAADDVVPVVEDTPVTGNVLANDGDVDGDTLTVASFTIGGTTYTAGQTATLAGIGTLVIGADGGFTFTPAANYTGPVPVATYTVTDGSGGTDTATLTLGPVTPVNDAPVAADDVVPVAEDTPATGNVLANDGDVDGDTLTVASFTIGGTTYTAGQTATLAGIGTLVIGADGGFTFTPAANYTGPVPVATYTVTDGSGGTDTATLTLGPVTPVNDAPVAADDVVPVAEDTPATGNVLANDGDVDGDTLTVASFTIGGTTYTAGQPATLAGIGTLVIGADGGFTFTPAPNYTGPVPVATYTVTDGSGGTDTATLTLGPVTPVNDAPVARDDSVSVEPDRASRIPVLGNDTDPDGDPLQVISAVPRDGTVSINPDGSITFIPPPGFFGTTTITYVVSDPSGATSTATVTVVVDETPAPAPDTAPPPAPPVAPQPIEPIAVEGIVLDTVQNIGGLGSISGGLGERGIVVAAVNQAGFLRGTAAADAIGLDGSARAIDPYRIWEIERVLMESTHGSGNGRGTWLPEGLTGFSLRLGLLGDSDGGDVSSGSRSQIVLESLVRDRTLIVQISNTLADPSRNVSEYRVLQANGEPLPGWLERLDGGLLIGQRPADLDWVELKVTVIYTDGTSETKSVRIETTSGDIQPIAPRGAGLGVPFGAQFAEHVQVDRASVEALAAMLRD